MPSNVAVMLSRRCNMRCGHCSVESNPRIKRQPSEAALHELVDGLLRSGVGGIQFTGGEPMLREALLLELMCKARDAGLPVGLSSNGFWGKKPDRALDTLVRLKNAGLTRLTISFDRFHAEFQGPQPVLNIVEAARRLNLTVNVNITRSLDDTELDEIVEPFRGLHNAHLRFYDVQPVGFARNLSEPLRGQMDGFCSACEQATFTDNGRVLACNGPSYFERNGSGLVVGEFGSGKSSVPELLALHRTDPVLETIRTDGPLALKKVLEGLPGFQDFPFKEHYSGMCELCLQINASPDALAALREELSRPPIAAERLARRLVLQANRQDGFNRHAVNQRLAPLAVLKLALGQNVGRIERVMGRADLDWEGLARVFAEAGLVRLLEREGNAEPLARWAPRFFWRRTREGTDRRAEPLEIPGLAGEHGLRVTPWGSTALALWGSPRCLDSTSWSVRKSDVQVARDVLEKRAARPVRIRPEEETGLGERERIAWELLKDWRDRLYKGGLEAAWDVAYLLGKGAVNWEDVLRHAASAGQRTCVIAGLEFLRREPGLPLPRFHLKSPLRRLLPRFVGHQFYRSASQGDNLFLEFALGLQGLDSLRFLPLALGRGAAAFFRGLKEGGARRGLHDLAQAGYFFCRTLDPRAGPKTIRREPPDGGN